MKAAGYMYTFGEFKISTLYSVVLLDCFSIGLIFLSFCYCRGQSQRALLSSNSDNDGHPGKTTDFPLAS